MKIQAQPNLCATEKKLEEKTREVDHLFVKITELQEQLEMKEHLKKWTEDKGRDLSKKFLEKDNEIRGLRSRTYEPNKLFGDEVCFKNDVGVKPYDEVSYLKEMLQVCQKWSKKFICGLFWFKIQLTQRWKNHAFDSSSTEKNFLIGTKYTTDLLWSV